MQVLRSEQNTESSASTQLQILFVEDDLELGPLLQRVLKEHNYDTQWVTNAEDALVLLPVVEPKLIISDRMLPGMDGISFCKSVRAKGQNVQILMLTAMNADNNLVEGLDAGADDYLGKPFSYQVLLAKVRAMLRRHQTRKASIFNWPI